MKLKSAIILQSRSLRQFAIKNHIAYSVLHDICSGKKSLLDCKTSTVIKIAKGLNCSVEELVLERAFPQFRDTLHNSIRQSGDLPWLIKELKENRAIILYENGEVLHAMYLVDMIDYICSKYELPVPDEYQFIREMKLDEPYYIGDWHIVFSDNHDGNPDNAIPEFRRSNIFEYEVYDAV